MSEKGENCFFSAFSLVEKIREGEREHKRQYQMSCGKMQKAKAIENERKREREWLKYKKEEISLKFSFFFSGNCVRNILTVSLTKQRGRQKPF